MNGEDCPDGRVWWAAPAAVASIGLVLLSWRLHDLLARVAAGRAADDAAGLPRETSWSEQMPFAYGHLTLLGVGAMVLAAQLLLAYRSRRCMIRPVRIATATVAALICIALLAVGHQALRMRSPKHESLDGLLLRGRPAAVSHEQPARSTGLHL